MAAARTIAAALIFALGALSCDKPGAEAVSRPDTFEGVTLTVPAGWDSTPDPAYGSRMYRSPVEGPSDDFRENFAVSVKTVAADVDLAAFWESYRASVVANADYTVEKTVDVTLAGRPAKYGIAVSASKARTYVQWAFALGSGRFMVFTGTTPNATRERSLVSFRGMAESARLDG